MPVWWGKNQAGMQAWDELGERGKEQAQHEWLEARDSAVRHARSLHTLGVHKQIVNRILEPWMWITVLVSATDFGNWFHLRCHKDAQPEIKRAADMMHVLRFGIEGEMNATQPIYVGLGFHCPLTGFPGDEDLCEEDLCKVSVGRCARVSYLTHDGKRDPKADIDLCARLAAAGHWSPFEHVAQAMGPMDFNTPSGNFRGWSQYRKQFIGEHRSEYDREHCDDAL